ncbi:AN1-type zinc finger protein 6 isoform X2 [Gouania willdenowi]|uniref:AN1-type zinc finger protein 6 isoform X2 n=1 Tax=Gouania willdenowi TaxID=441366 RepID=UPI001054DD6E|nr:AN1-type zinc finger protein 5-like isoform X2 [Gouania willdenowi]
MTWETNQRCSTGCGFYGNSKTEGMCSVCYKNFLQRQISAGQVNSSEPEVVVDQAKRTRCFYCHKKIGHIGFDCRCGNLFCGKHRCAEVHNCTFDYKADAAEKMKNENPVVAPEKIHKI